MPNKYLDSVQLARLVTKIKSLVSTTVADYLPLTGGSITGNLSVSGTITGDVTGTASGNLPLSGGTLTGGLYLNPDTTSGKGGVVGRTDSGIRLAAEAFGVSSAGAYIDLVGRNYSTNAGAFNIAANSATASKLLTGKTDGSLKWANKEIERVNASGTKYIRYESGLQICFSSTSASNAGTSVTFPVAFSSNPVITVSAVNSTASAWVTDVSTTAFSAHTSTGAWLWYIAIGSWA